MKQQRIRPPGPPRSAMSPCEWCVHPPPPIEIRPGDPTSEEIERGVIRAIQMLLRHDSFLLDKDVNERSVTHKLAEYLQREFGGWHVDCEYNRVGNESNCSKILKDLAEKLYDSGLRREAPTGDPRQDTVFPDIIVHHRGDKTDNLLVLEVKKFGNNHNAQSIDKMKLELYVERLKYRFAAFLLLRTRAQSANNQQWSLEWLSSLQRTAR